MQTPRDRNRRSGFFSNVCGNDYSIRAQLAYFLKTCVFFNDQQFAKYFFLVMQIFVLYLLFIIKHFSIPVSNFVMYVYYVFNNLRAKKSEMTTIISTPHKSEKPKKQRLLFHVVEFSNLIEVKNKLMLNKWNTCSFIMNLWIEITSKLFLKIMSFRNEFIIIAYRDWQFASCLLGRIYLKYGKYFISTQMTLDDITNDIKLENIVYFNGFFLSFL